MKISIIHPSRNRPHLAVTTIKAWLSSAKERENIEYILSIDIDEPEHNKVVYTQLPVDVYCHDNKSAIEAINYAATKSTGDLLIVVSDDFNQPPFHWDEALRVMLADKHDYIVKTDDGVQPWIITLPIMDRKYYQRFGYVYYPGYDHMFADTEMTHISDLLARKIILPIRIPHNHYSTGKSTKDNVNIKNDKTWTQGEKLYLERLEHGFDLTSPPGILSCDTTHMVWLQSKGVEFVAAV